MMLWPRIAISPTASAPSTVVPVVVDAASLDAPDRRRRSSRAARSRSGSAEAGDRRGLGQAVALEDLRRRTCSLNCLMTSTGSAAPPATATPQVARRSARRRRPRSSAPSRPQYIVGTPAKKVTFSCCISASAGSASKRGSSTSGAADGEAGVHAARSGRRSGTAAARTGGCRAGSASAPNRSVARQRVHHACCGGAARRPWAARSCPLV